MFVLGIDPGLTTTGYGVIETSGRTVSAVAAGVIRTDAGRSTAGRLAELHRDITDLVDEFPPATAAIEEVFVNRNRGTAMAVGRASGVIMLALQQAGISVTEYTPSAVKMALTGYGSADKQQVSDVVAMRLKLSVRPHPADAADALAIALCHMQAEPMRKAVEGAAR